MDAAGSEWEAQCSRMPQQRRQRQEGSDDRYPSPCMLEAPVAIDWKFDKDRTSHQKRNTCRKRRRGKICATYYIKDQPERRHGERASDDSAGRSPLQVRGCRERSDFSGGRSEHEKKVRRKEDGQR